jgi:hypothetical protein
MKNLLRFCLVFACLQAFAFTPTKLIHKEIFVSLDLKKHLISGHTFIEFPSGQDTATFYLNANLSVELETPGNIEEINGGSNKSVKTYQLSSLGSSKVKLSFSGRIFDDYKVDGHSNGIISEDAVVLFTSTYWAPYFNELFTFDLSVDVRHPNWEVISTGELAHSEKTPIVSRFTWKENSPSNDLYLIAGDYKKYELSKNGIVASVYLKQAEPALANRYLSVTHDYIDHYGKTIGAYPYKKFATIEGPWENMGFGMPSFTILGPSVIRFPWILYSSYPHEVLHNWWGNGVYVNYQAGNWCEGLTNYMADHWMQDTRGQAASYRRSALQNYQDYVGSSNEFALKDFRGRHNSSSQAIGYGKAMMFFHMLKVQLGSTLFDQGLKDFYKNNLFRAASYSDIKKSFENVSGQDLDRVFNQWVNKIGAPAVSLHTVSKKGDKVYLTLEQSNKQGVSYSLWVPVELLDHKGSIVKSEVLELKSSKMSYTFDEVASVKELRVDPRFDVFRLLQKGEVPAALSSIYGEQKKTTLILPKKDRSKYLLWVNEFRKKLSGIVEVIHEEKLKSIPADGSVWIMGQSKWKSIVAQSLDLHGMKLSGSKLTGPKETYNSKKHSFVLSLDHPKKQGHFLGYVSIPTSGNFARVAQKMSHYGKYGVIVFEDEKNLLKHSWQAILSPMHHKF